MKKIIIICSVAAFTLGCAGNGSKDENTAEKKDSASVVEAAPASSPEQSPDYEKGLSLIAKSDCLTCHKVDEKLTGPAYRDVANKYPDTPDTIDTLAAKVIKGGAGVWGAVPMTPHPTISEADAKQMVKYILLLKNNK